MLFKLGDQLLALRASTFVVIALSSCTTFQSSTPPTPLATSSLFLYQTPTPTLTSPSATPEITILPQTLPTPTPFIYLVSKNETLIEIASRFNLTLDELRLANPQVDPRFLSVGAELYIPTGTEKNQSVDLPSPTPIPLGTDMPSCYPILDGRLTCYWLVENHHTAALENITGVISLFNQLGEKVSSQTALIPLNLLEPDAALPMTAHFPAPVPEWTEIRTQMLTTLQVTEDSNRYLNTVVKGLETILDPSGLQATVKGQVLLEDESRSAGLIWVVAVAYDKNDRVVGFRRWEYTDNLTGQDRVEFNFQVFSLSSEIERIDILVEARPK